MTDRNMFSVISKQHTEGRISVDPPNKGIYSHEYIIYNPTVCVHAFICAYIYISFFAFPRMKSC